MKIFNRFKSELGQDLLEFALTLPILIMLLLMIFDLGRVVYYYSALTNTAREGARTAILYGSDNGDIQAAVCNLAVGIDIGCPNPPISVETLDLELDGNNYADHVRVGVSYSFQPVTPLVKLFMDLGESDSIQLNSQATMRLEY